MTRTLVGGGIAKDWVPVDGYRGRYEVNDWGQVRSLLGRAPRLMRTSPAKKHGYWTVTLYDAKGKKRPRRVHQLVLRAFVGPAPQGMGGCHRDGDKANNRLSNLEYKTQLGNMADRALHGNNPKGERNAKAKLTAADVVAIRASSDTCVALGAKYGVDARTISGARNKVTWRHV